MDGNYINYVLDNLIMKYFILFILLIILSGCIQIIQVVPTQVITQTYIPTKIIKQILDTPIQTSICNKNSAIFISENYPDGTVIKPDQGFNKTWRIRNNGSCIWGAFKLVFYSGSPMSKINPIVFNKTVQPNEIIEITIPLIAPHQSGNHESYWILQDLGGIYFEGLNKLNVQINVKNY